MKRKKCSSSSCSLRLSFSFQISTSLHPSLSQNKRLPGSPSIHLIIPRLAWRKTLLPSSPSYPNPLEAVEVNLFAATQLSISSVEEDGGAIPSGNMTARLWYHKIQTLFPHAASFFAVRSRGPVDSAKISSGWARGSVGKSNLTKPSAHHRRTRTPVGKASAPSPSSSSSSFLPQRRGPVNRRKGLSASRAAVGLPPLLVPLHCGPTNRACPHALMVAA